MQNPFDRIVEFDDWQSPLHCKACGKLIKPNGFGYHFPDWRDHFKKCKGIGAIIEADELIRKELEPFLNRIFLSLDQV